MVGDEASVPSEDRVRLHQENRLAAASEYPSEGGEDRSVGGFEARTGDLSSQDGELMAQHEDLDIFGAIVRPRSTTSRSRAGKYGRNGPRADPRSAQITSIWPARNPRAAWPDRLSAPTG
jgi:hypothetical protein